MDRNFFRAVLHRGATFGLAALLALGAHAASAQTRLQVGMATTSMGDSWIFVAQGMGFWKELGLDVEPIILGGPGNVQALMAGDVQFANVSGTAILSAVAHGQGMQGIAAVYGRLMEEVVISNQAAARTGLTRANSTATQRAAALKGMNIAVDDPNTVLDAFLTHVLRKGGLDPDKDVVRPKVQPPAVNVAMEQGKIDGFSAQPPWTTIAEQKKTGVVWVSGMNDDSPELQPFAFASAAARADYCQKNPDICTKFVAGVHKAVQFMQTDPAKSEALIGAQLKGMDSALIHADFENQRHMLVLDSKFTDQAWDITQKFDLDAGLIKPENAVSGFNGKTYTNAYVK